MDPWSDIFGFGLDFSSWERAASQNRTGSSSASPKELAGQIFQQTNNRLVGSAGRTFKCKMCFLICESKTEHQLHNQTHARELKPYRCPQCIKCFANASYLSQHMRIHLGLKPYACDICKRCFTQLSHLQQHLRTHTGDKPYRCYHPGCQKAFSQLSNLQSHGRCHETDKPFRCYSCYKTFYDEAALRDHIPKHRESKHTKTHICNYCGKAYTQALYLASHITTKHQDKMDKQRLGMPQMSDFLSWTKPDSCASFNSNGSYGQENFLSQYNTFSGVSPNQNGYTALTANHDYDNMWNCWSKSSSSAFSAFNVGSRPGMFTNLQLMSGSGFSFNSDRDMDNALQSTFGSMNDSWATSPVNSKSCFSDCNILSGNAGQDNFRNFIIPV